MRKRRQLRNRRKTTISPRRIPALRRRRSRTPSPRFPTSSRTFLLRLISRRLRQLPQPHLEVISRVDQRLRPITTTFRKPLNRRKLLLVSAKVIFVQTCSRSIQTENKIKRKISHILLSVFFKAMRRIRKSSRITLTACRSLRALRATALRRKKPSKGRNRETTDELPLHHRSEIKKILPLSRVSTARSLFCSAKHEVGVIVGR